MILAYINNDAIPAEGCKFAVEIYETSHDGSFTGAVEYESYKLECDAANRVDEINSMAFKTWDEFNCYEKLPKKAFLVDFGITTRIVVASDLDEEKIAEIAINKLLEDRDNLRSKMFEGFECNEDEEVPYEEVFYQPYPGEANDNLERLGLDSFSVYKSFTNCKRDYPNEKIVAYTRNDIENPVFIDA